jgi:hypothetical protein
MRSIVTEELFVDIFFHPLELYSGIINQRDKSQSEILSEGVNADLAEFTLPLVGIFLKDPVVALCRLAICRHPVSGAKSIGSNRRDY